MAQVGALEVPVLPVFKGFRTVTDREVGAAERSASSIFTRGFSKTGAESGAAFSKSFGSATAGATSKLSQDVARATQAVSAARLKEQDATGKARIAVAQLTEAYSKYSATSSQVIRAEERVASSARQVVTAQDAVKNSTDRLAAAKRNLASASDASTVAAGGWQTRFNGIFRGAGEQSASSFGGGFRNAFPTIFGAATLANVVSQGAFAVGRGIGDAIQAGVGYAFDAFGAASQLQQSVGAIEAVFAGAGAETILNFSATAARDVGLAKAQYQQFATVVGAQLKNLGVPLGDVATRTDSLIDLGADLAAQFGGSTADAVGALSSLLRGERDPIERYGVGLKQIDIDARKAAMGLSDLEGEQDKQATIMATLALLYEQTASAQGTFNRETDTAAHKQQVLQARLADTQARFGESLLGPGTQFLDFVDTTLLPKLDQVLDKLGPQLGSVLQRIQPDIEKLLETSADALPGAVEALVSGLSFAADEVDALFGDGGFTEGFERTTSQVDQFFTDYLPRWAAGSVPVQESWDGFFNWWDLAWDGTADTVQNKSNEIRDYWRSTLDGMKADSVALSLTNEGYNFALGFADGIETGAEKAIIAAENMALRAMEKVNNAMEARSPSRKTRRSGGFFGQGFYLGIEDEIPNAERAAATMVSSSMSALDQSSFVRQMAASSSAARMPDTLTIVDADRQLIGRMRVEANGQIAQYDTSLDREVGAGRREP